MTFVQLTARSSNRKTGPVATSTTPRETCPSACPHKKTSCYGESGGKITMHWNRVDKGDVYASQTDWSAYCGAVASMRRGAYHRGEMIGDLPGIGNRITASAIKSLIVACQTSGVRRWSYTHKPIESGPRCAASTARRNRAILRNANGAVDGPVINISCDSLAAADRAVAAKVGPVVVVLPSTAPKSITTPGGNVIKTCPAQLSDKVTCTATRTTNGCGGIKGPVCANGDRTVIVGFLAHGNARQVRVIDGNTRC